MTQKKSIRAVSLVIRNDQGEVLVVRRPDDPRDDIAGVWGLPATTSEPGESEEETGRRVGPAKLGVTVSLGRRIGESTHERRAVTLHMVDYEAVIVDGAPSVPQPDDSITQYEELRFTNEPLDVLDAAQHGSQCTQIFLEDLGIDWKSSSS